MKTITCAVCDATDELTDTPVQIDGTNETKHLWLCPNHLDDLERYTNGEDIDWEDWNALDNCGCTDERLLGDADACDAQHPDKRFVCTRKPGHDGPHKACSPSEHPRNEWNECRNAIGWY